MKYLLLCVILSIAGLIIYQRLRPYIAFARRVLGHVRAAQRISTDGQRAPTAGPARAGEPLVRCAACGAWRPASRALVFRATKTAFWSPDCMERASSGSVRKRAGGGA